MQHLDDDIDLALDEPAPVRPGPVFYLAAGLAGLLCLATVAASFTGDLSVESRTFPLLVTVVAILAAIAAAYRRPAN